MWLLTTRRRCRGCWDCGRRLRARWIGTRMRAQITASWRRYGTWLIMRAIVRPTFIARTLTRTRRHDIGIVSVLVNTLYFWFRGWQTRYRFFGKTLLLFGRGFRLLRRSRRRSITFRCIQSWWSSRIRIIAVVVTAVTVVVAFVVLKKGRTFSFQRLKSLRCKLVIIHRRSIQMHEVTYFDEV